MWTGLALDRDEYFRSCVLFCSLSGNLTPAPLIGTFALALFFLDHSRRIPSVKYLGQERRREHCSLVCLFFLLALALGRGLQLGTRGFLLEAKGSLSGLLSLNRDTTSLSTIIMENKLGELHLVALQVARARLMGMDELSHSYL